MVNLTTSSVIDDVAKAHGRRVHRTAVGEANVVEMMQAVDAAIGGEGSNGGIIVPAVHLCRDSYAGMALLLDRMAETGQPISALAGALPRYARRLGTVPFEHGRLGTDDAGPRGSVPGSRADRTDGLKIAFSEGWVHVRASNTEPIMRLAVETRSQSETERSIGACFSCSAECGRGWPSPETRQESGRRGKRDPARRAERPCAEYEVCDGDGLASSSGVRSARGRCRKITNSTTPSISIVAPPNCQPICRPSIRSRRDMCRGQLAAEAAPAEDRMGARC